MGGNLEGSIPAWAGEPPFGVSLKVYPRVGGGTFGSGQFMLPAKGLSPRGRGNRPFALRRLYLRGSIPAWAGEPQGLPTTRAMRWVYPRVGGGTCLAILQGTVVVGLSPRGRGNLRMFGIDNQAPGSIPAWAGEPVEASCREQRIRVYPRVGGGTPNVSAKFLKNRGLSPRGRGNHRSCQVPTKTSGSIPAWAGEPRSSDFASALFRVYPRVGGGTGRSTNLTFPPRGLSPRGRGNLRFAAMVAISERSIPAWAGEPAASPAAAIPMWVYPRVGGGTHRTRIARGSSAGLSPRGRGNRSIRIKARGRKGSIPAWAGEPLPGGPRHQLGQVYPRVGGGTTTTSDHR